MTQRSSDQQLDLFVAGIDISQYVGTVEIEEDLVEWTIHVELVSNQVTASELQPLIDKTAEVKWRLRMKDFSGPWSSGPALVSWRRTETEREELILHGRGRLHKSDSSVRKAGVPITGNITVSTVLGGRVIGKEEAIGTITIVEEDPQEKAIREARSRLAQEAQIQTITSPAFVLFLAKSALSSHRLLHEHGLASKDGETIYASLIFLPLATEYYMKYLLIGSTGEFKNEYKTHRLMALFDFLPFEVQRDIEEAFADEMERIGRERTSQNLRVFLRKSQNAFTAIRYLFDSKNAETSRHLLEPENTAVLACVANALERVSKGT